MQVDAESCKAVFQGLSRVPHRALLVLKMRGYPSSRLGPNYHFQYLKIITGDENLETTKEGKREIEKGFTI